MVTNGAERVDPAKGNPQREPPVFFGVRMTKKKGANQQTPLDMKRERSELPPSTENDQETPRGQTKSHVDGTLDDPSLGLLDVSHIFTNGPGSALHIWKYVHSLSQRSKSSSMKRRALSSMTGFVVPLPFRHRKRH